jgi:hypothetical protein
MSRRSQDYERSQPPKRFAFHLPTIALLVALVLVGVGTKFYRGRCERWVHYYAGGIVYEVFWILLLGTFFPRLGAGRIAIFVFVVTCGLEFLQLWHPRFLELLRSNFIGRALLGNGFDLWDFVYYIIGSTIGWLLCRGMVPGSYRRPAMQ